MRHGRPDKQWYEFCGKQYHLCRSSDGLGWRREHAARVFQAIQAVVAVVVTRVVELVFVDPETTPDEYVLTLRKAGW